MAITDSEIDQSAGSPIHLFRIELQYGEIKWTVRRSITEFYGLKLALQSQRFKFGHHHRLSSRSDSEQPSFPAPLETLMHSVLASMGLTRDDEEGLRAAFHRKRGALERYLLELVQRSTKGRMIHYELCEFLELSAISLVRDMGWKGKEGYLECRRVVPDALKRTAWVKEWVILRDS